MIRTIGAALLAIAALTPVQQAAAQDPVGGAIVGGALAELSAAPLAAVRAALSPVR